MIVPTSAVVHYLNAKLRQGFLNYEVIVIQGTHGEISLSSDGLKLVKEKLYERSHPE
jgi:hypothetical protein